MRQPLKKLIPVILTALLLSACGRSDEIAPEPVQKEAEQVSETKEKTAVKETETPETEEAPAPETETETEPVTEEQPTETEAPIKTGTPFERYGALSVQGTDLVGADGAPVQLKGISTHGFNIFPQFVNEEAFREFRDDWGATLIRLAMYTAEDGGYLTGGDKGAIENTLHQGVEACHNLGLYCIIDWHILSDGNPNWHKEEAKDFFSRMSAKYAAYANVLYEICNEPNSGTSWSEIKAYADEIIPVIRANAPDAVILVGTPNWSQDVDLCAQDPVQNPANVMYTLHFYAATHKEWLQEKLTRARDQGTPVFVSEFGICDASGNGGLDYDSAGKWMALLDSCKISYAAWNLSNKNESSALIRPECEKTSGFTDGDLSESGLWLKQYLGKD